VVFNRLNFPVGIAGLCSETFCDIIRILVVRQYFIRAW
jgi:hypothetical protein